MEEIAGSRCRPARRPVGGEGTASGRDKEKKKESSILLPSESDVWKRESSSEDEVWIVFGAELDCGKVWRSRSLGAGVDQPEDPWGNGFWQRQGRRKKKFYFTAVRKRRLEAREQL